MHSQTQNPLNGMKMIHKLIPVLFWRKHWCAKV